MKSTQLAVVLILKVAAGMALQPRLLVLGLGNVGRAVVHEAESHDYFDKDRIQGTSRSSTYNGAILFSPDTIRSVLPDCTHVLITIPPPREEDPVFDDVVQELESNLCRGAWLGFVSTSGVYGHHDGDWVTEESPLRCSEDSPTFRYIRHEEEWQERSRHCGWTYRVFRCAGLYGSDRSALHTLWKRKVLDVSRESGITNRIHETDVARAIVASMTMPPNDIEEVFRLYNLSDDEPESRTVVMQYAANLLKSIDIAIPIVESSDSSPSTTRSRRRGTELKRVSNQRMKDELINELLYPTYREGLSAILQDPSCPWWN